jgi:hypothetical protein
MSYDGLVTEFDDRLLAHLHIVIVQQFKRQESFAMSWLNGLNLGNGRTSIWLHPDASITFTFAGSKPPTIDETWLRRLTDSARSSHGLLVTNEAGQLARSTGSRRQ